MVKRKVTVIIFSKLLKINFMNIILPALLKKKIRLNQNQVSAESWKKMVLIHNR